jgi:hypothetical protein
MSVEGRINLFRAAVAAQLKAAMPALASCEEQFGRFDLDELETTIVRAPAVRFSVLRARLPATASGQQDAALECAAFIVTDGRDRDRQAWAIAEAIAVTLQPPGLWGLTQLGAPAEIVIQPAVTAKLKQRAVSLMAVEWKQELRQLGTDIFDDAGHLLEELYVNDEPVDLDELAGEGEAP